MKLNILSWLVLIIAIPTAISFVLLVWPHKIIMWQGKFYRRIYKDMRGLTDKEIDALYQLPTDRFFMGRRSDFITNAPHTPEKYTHLIRVYRIIGIVILIFVLITVGLLLLATTTT